MVRQLSTLKRGDAGYFVEQLQTQLMHWEVLNQRDIDGRFGPVTEGGVKKFQAMRPVTECRYSPEGLRITGIVQRNDWCELLRLKPEEIEIVEIPTFVTKAQAEAIFENPISNAQLADLNSCLQRFDITTPARIRHFMAQIAHESGGLRWLKELASGERYDPEGELARRLGNIYKGDGPRFKGAGAIQLTGRYNYQRFADFIGDSRVMEGVDYVAKMYPFTSAGFWWRDNKMNQFVDSGATCRQVSARVSGRDPANGLEDRERCYQLACQCASDAVYA